MTIRKLIVLPLLLAACATEDPTSARSQVAVSMSTAEAAVVLAFVNYPGTTAEVLDQKVGLDVRAADNIVAYRNGKDGVSPSDDDVFFKDLTELDAVPYVGDSAFSKLLTYSLANPAPADEAVEGVLFRGWQSEAVVYGVNHATVAALDVMLDVRAATNLVANGPYSNVAAMGAVANVGPSALTILRAHAAGWWQTMHAAPAPTTATYDGVTFDAATEKVALEIANLASNYDLVMHGMYTTGAARMVFARPYATLADVAAVQDVGTACMKVLHDWAASGTWVAPEPEECSVNLTSRTDADVADFSRLLKLATTGDWPFAEMIAQKVNTCIDMRDPGEKDSVFDDIMAARLINWGYESPWQYLSADDFASGSSQYLSLVASARDAIQEHVQAGQWKPANTEEQALLNRLPVLYSNLTAAAAANPARFFQTTVVLDMEECSQRAAILVDTVGNKVTIIHRFPLC